MSQDFPEEAAEKLEGYVVRAMTESHVPGLSIALVKEGQVVYAKGFGARNVEQNLPATADTLYGVGSCTKSFTALAIMQLAEEGKLSIDDPAKKFVPLKISGGPEPILIHHLMSHSSGIPCLGTAEVLIRRATGEEGHWIPLSSSDDLMLHINGAGSEVAAPPGKRYFYFNGGFAMLGEIIERISGMKYEEYVKNRILKPLGMNRSVFTREEFEKDSNVMTAYGKDKEANPRATVHPFHKFIYAPGGLLTSVKEHTNYLVMNMNGGIYQDNRLVDKASLEAMHRPCIDVPKGFFGPEGYAYGWRITEDFLGHKLVSHGGSTGVSSAYVGFIPDLKIGVALAANTSPYGSASMTMGALALLMGKDPEKELPFMAIEERMKQLVGKYEGYKSLRTIQVVKKGAMLYLE